MLKRLNAVLLLAGLACSGPAPAESDTGALIWEAVTASDAARLASLLGSKSVAIPNDADGNTPLHKASTAEIARLLLKAGVKINAPGDSRKTPLQAAALRGAHEVAMFLVKAGADVNAMGRVYPPLRSAAASGDKELVEALLVAGAKVDAAVTNQDSALEIAAKNGHKEIAELLIAHGADVNFEGLGRNPIVAAAYGGQKEVVELLVAHGADVNAPGLGSLDWALRGKDQDSARTQAMVAFLRKHGAVEHPADFAARPVTESGSGSSTSNTSDPLVTKLKENGHKAALALGYRVVSEGGNRASYRSGDLTLDTEVIRRSNGSASFSGDVSTSDDDERADAARRYRAVLLKLMGAESVEKAGFELDGNIAGY